MFCCTDNDTGGIRPTVAGGEKVKRKSRAEPKGTRAE